MSKCGSGRTCRPTVQCSAQIPDTKDLKNLMCQLEDGSSGTCCNDVPKSWVKEYKNIYLPNIFQKKKFHVFC